MLVVHVPLFRLGSLKKGLIKPPLKTLVFDTLQGSSTVGASRQTAAPPKAAPLVDPPIVGRGAHPRLPQVGLTNPKSFVVVVLSGFVVLRVCL